MKSRMVNWISGQYLLSVVVTCAVLLTQLSFTINADNFTHNLLFTAGSLEYVLKCAGFSKIMVLDPYGTSNNPILIRFVRQILVKMYYYWKRFWMKIMGNSYHVPSPVVYTWEVKVIATLRVMRMDISFS